jgi:hypothetical protein
MRRLLFLLLLAPGSAIADPAAPSGDARSAALDATLALAPCADADRLDAVIAAFRAAGAAPEELRIEKLGSTTNLRVHVAGVEDERIVVGAHYDKVKAGCGVIDDWTGISLIVSLYRRLHDQAPRRAIDLVAFGREEEGRLGSIAMARALDRQGRLGVCAMLNLDSFGLGPVQVMSNASNRSMIELARATAAAEGRALRIAPLFHADADSSSFRHRSIPALTLHGVTGDWPNILHSTRDVRGAIDLSELADSERFAWAVLQRLDRVDCARLR